MHHNNPLLMMNSAFGNDARIALPSFSAVGRLYKIRCMHHRKYGHRGIVTFHKRRITELIIKLSEHEKLAIVIVDCLFFTTDKKAQMNFLELAYEWKQKVAVKYFNHKIMKFHCQRAPTPYLHLDISMI